MLRILSEMKGKISGEIRKRNCIARLLVKIKLDYALSSYCYEYYPVLYEKRLKSDCSETSPSSSDDSYCSLSYLGALKYKFWQSCMNAVYHLEVVKSLFFFDLCNHNLTGQLGACSIAAVLFQAYSPLERWVLSNGFF